MIVHCVPSFFRTRSVSQFVLAQRKYVGDRRTGLYFEPHSILHTFTKAKNLKIATYRGQFPINNR